MKIKALLFSLFFLVASNAFAANSLTTDPIVLDTVGATSAVTTDVWVTAIMVNPSATSWDVLIEETSGGVDVFDNFGAAKEPFVLTFPKPQKFNGLYATTLTNASVLIYLK